MLDIFNHALDRPKRNLATPNSPQRAITILWHFLPDLRHSAAFKRRQRFTLIESGDKDSTAAALLLSWLIVYTRRGDAR